MEISSTSIEALDRYSKSSGTDGTGQSTASIVAPGPSYDRYFEIAVVCIGVVGALANGMLLYILISTKEKKTRNTLILNQTALDLFGCLALILCYAVSMMDIYLSGLSGLIICQVIDTEIFIWIGMNGSTSSLVTIALERYWKIVHPVSHKTHFRQWMIPVVISACWIHGILVNVPAAWVSTRIVNGTCVPSSFWSNPMDGVAFVGFYLVWEFVLPIGIFVYTYWHILMVIVRSGKVANQSSAIDLPRITVTQPPNKRRRNAVKTFATITVFFAICWLPNDIYFFLMNLPNSTLQMGSPAWDVTLVFIYLNVCLNPFIYAAQYDMVRKDMKVLLNRLVRWDVFREESIGYPLVA